MLAWVVIDRMYFRQFLPKSSSPRTLCLCVEFSDSFRPTSVVPTTYALHLATAAPQPLCNQSVTHSFYLDGGCIPPVALPSRQRSSRMPIPVPYILYFSISCALFALFCAPQKLNAFIFKRFRTLRQKTQSPGGWGKGYVSDPQVLAVFLQIQRGQSGQLSLGSAARQSRVTSHQSLPLGALPFAPGYRSARIRMEPHDT